MVSFGQAVKTCLSKYVTFKGRASRAEYWWFYLFTFIIGLIAGFIDGMIGISIISKIASLAFILPGLAAAVRRCHDTNHSGWWILCPIYNIVLMFLPSNEGANDYGTLEEETETL